MKKYLILATLCLGAFFTKASAQSLTIVNGTPTSQSIVLGASNGTCPSCCSGITSGIIQMKPSSTIVYANINDLCSKGNVWIGSACPSSLTVAGSHWDMAKVIAACGFASVGSGCAPLIKTTASLCTGATVKWTTGTGGNVTVTIN